MDLVQREADASSALVMDQVPCWWKNRNKKQEKMTFGTSPFVLLRPEGSQGSRAMAKSDSTADGLCVLENESYYRLGILKLFVLQV